MKESKVEKEEFERIMNSGATIKIIMSMSQIKKACSYTNIAKTTNITLSHVMKMVRMLVSSGILELAQIKIKRKAQIKISEKGKQIALKLNELKEAINSQNGNKNNQT